MHIDLNIFVSGGIYHDCAVHDIDMIINVIGEYPTSVSAVGKANIQEIAAIDDHDTVAILLSFDSGTIGIIDLSRYSNYGYDQRLEVRMWLVVMLSDVNRTLTEVIYTRSGLNRSVQIRLHVSMANGCFHL